VYTKLKHDCFEREVLVQFPCGTRPDGSPHMGS